MADRHRWAPEYDVKRTNCPGCIERAPQVMIGPDGITVVHVPPNTLLRVNEIWAFVSIDKDGHEGICGYTLPNGMPMPLLAADEERLASIRPMAQLLANLGKNEIKLVKFCQREEVEILKAKGDMEHGKENSEQSKAETSH